MTRIVVIGVIGVVWRRWWKRGAIVVLLLVTAVLAWLRMGPLPAGLLDPESRPSTIVVDRHGETLHEARSLLGLRGEWIEPQQLPPLVAHATLAAEDVRFRWHPGLDPIAITRATWRNLREGQVEEGGSTITQQVAKMLLARQAGGTSAHGWRAKLREAVVALRLEHRLTKTDILALYVNLAPYGNQIQGIGRASRAYFGRSLDTLTAAEVAFLAALPQQPSRFNPWRNPTRAHGRQQHVLTVMAGRHWIGADVLAAARTEQLTLSREDSAWLAPHFIERVMTEVADAHPRHVSTTLDAGLQRTIHGIIAAERESLTRHHASNVAVAVLDNHTGEWLAWEGSGNYLDEAHGGAIDGVIAPRQPGSALKPFTYAAAFERGFHPGHVLPDVPSQFPTDAPGVSYSPRNYDNRFRGPMLARTALAGSENVPAVALASEIGVPTIARLLRRVGLTSLDNNAAHYGLGLTLGNAEVGLGELVAAYATFARGGEWLAPVMIRSVDGNRPATNAPERILSLRTAFWITDILSDAGAREYAFGRGGSLEFPFAVAVKTGTSQSYFDNWVVGYTRDVTVGVWVGNFDRTPLRGSSGVTGAGPIFHSVMLAAVERVRGTVPIGDLQPILHAPADVSRHEICALSGMTAGDACPTRASEWLPQGHAPETCTWHHGSDRGLVTIWPDVYRDWARQNGVLVTPSSSFSAPIVGRGDGAADSGTSSTTQRAAAPHLSMSKSTGLTIVRPLAGGVFLLDPTLRPEYQMLSLAARGGAGTLHWFVDGAALAEAAPDEAVRWPLVRGRHEVLVRDSAGREARSHLTVR